MNLSNPPKTVQAEVVYVVDDDEAVRDSLTWLLESNGYTVRCHASAERFLQSLQNTDKSTISCLILVTIPLPLRELGGTPLLSISFSDASRTLTLSLKVRFS